MTTDVGYVPQGIYAPVTINFQARKVDAATKIGIDVMKVVLPGGWEKPFAFVYCRDHYAGIEHPALRLDLDLADFIDLFDDEDMATAFRPVAREVIEALAAIQDRESTRATSDRRQI